MSQFDIMFKSMKCLTRLHRKVHITDFWLKTEPVDLFLQNFRTFVKSQQFQMLVLCIVLKKKWHWNFHYLIAYLYLVFLLLCKKKSTFVFKVLLVGNSFHSFLLGKNLKLPINSLDHDFMGSSFHNYLKCINH